MKVETSPLLLDDPQHRAGKGGRKRENEPSVSADEPTDAVLPFFEGTARAIRSEREGRLVSSQRRADLDALAHQLRAEGLTFQAIAEELGVTPAMARR